MAANSIAEYRDYMNGIDSQESKGESEIPLQHINNPKMVYILGCCCFVLGAVSGLIALYLVGPYLLFPGLSGAILVWSYSEKPLGYKYKAMGELGVFLAFGPILCYACIYSLNKPCCLKDLLVSVPLGLLVSNVMLANNIRDCKFDMAIRNKTIPTILGIKMAYSILFISTHISYFVLLFIADMSTIWPVFLTYPVIFASIKYINTNKIFYVFLLLQVLFCLTLGCVLFCK
jgi:1,4-dihydroxy-2-naphthoate octaprenyltransferase